MARSYKTDARSESDRDPNMRMACASLVWASWCAFIKFSAGSIHELLPEGAGMIRRAGSEPDGGVSGVAIRRLSAGKDAVRLLRRVSSRSTGMAGIKTSTVALERGGGAVESGIG